MAKRYKFERFKWPKVVPSFSADEKKANDEFFNVWLNKLPSKYKMFERFNHTYPLRSFFQGCRSIEIGVGTGGHLSFEDIDAHSEYVCLELRSNLLENILHRFPNVTAAVGDCQKRIPYENDYFDRAIAIHVLEHLPDLPAALAEMARVLKKGAKLSAVIPCDPGLAYEFARRISAKPMYEKMTGLSYVDFISREHLNCPSEVIHCICEHFDIVDKTYFPFNVPVNNVNLCIGITAVVR